LAAAAGTNERGGRNGEEDALSPITTTAAPLTRERSTEPPIGGDAPRRRAETSVAVDAGRRIGKSLSGKKGESMRHLFPASGIAAVVAAAALTFVPIASANPSKVLASDACSPSFNDPAAGGPGTCTRRGGTPFDVFIAQLQQNKFAGAWHFSPKQVNVDADDSLTVENRGGETHTFSEVSQFGGGGIVPPLNEILFGTPNPPTFFLPNPPGQPTNFIPAGGEIAIGPNTLTPGTHLFICAIHPWMEDTVVVR